MSIRQLVVALCGSMSLLCAQQEASAGGPDAQLREAHAAWQAKWDAFVAASRAARESGKVEKGGELPAPVQAVEQQAAAAAAEVLQRFGGRDDLSAASELLLARLQETSRDYGGAVHFYARSLQKGDPAAPDLRTMRSLCIAALNSKDDALAAEWMSRTIAAEDRQGGRRDNSVRATYYPRVLIALGDWQGLEDLVRRLEADDSAECRAAARTFGIVGRMHRGDVAGASRLVDEMLQDAANWPDHQGWATMARYALCVHAGDFEQGAAVVRRYLAVPAEQRSQRDRLQHRYLAAVEPFLGKPAPALRSDHCVAGDLVGGDLLPSLRGKVVVLDFWQPWCEPCRKAMPEMVAAQQEYDGKVQVLGVCKVENYGYDVSERKAVRPIEPADYPAHVEDFHGDMALNYPLLICNTDQNSRSYRIAGVPTLVIVDRDGIVRYMSCGAGEPGLFRLALAGVVGAR